MSVEEAAKVLSTTEGYVRVLINRGKLAVIRHGTGKRAVIEITSEEIERYANRKKK